MSNFCQIHVKQNPFVETSLDSECKHLVVDYFVISMNTFNDFVIV